MPKQLGDQESLQDLINALPRMHQTAIELVALEPPKPLALKGGEAQRTPGWFSRTFGRARAKEKVEN